MCSKVATGVILTGLVLVLGNRSLAGQERVSDEFVRGMARRNVDQDIEIGKRRGLLNQPILDVVPVGETRPVAEILETLNLTRDQLERHETWQEGNVIFLEYRLSDSYALSIMLSARENRVDDPEDLERMAGYGVRIVAVE